MVTQSWNGGTLRLRFRYEGKRYALTIPPDHHQNKILLTKLTELIAADIRSETLDTTLDRYRSEFKLRQALLPFKSPVYRLHFADLFRQWTTRQGINLDHNQHFEKTYKLLLEWNAVTPEQIAQNLILLNCCGSSFNRRRIHLLKFCDWLIRTGHILQNPITDIRPKKGDRRCESREPFSMNEMSQILEAMRTNSHCPSKNAFKHSHYYIFVKFIFHTGVRVGEAVALQVKDLDLHEGRAHIHKAYGKQPAISGDKKVFKETKTEGSRRSVQLSPQLCQDLAKHIRYKKPEDLLFTGPRGAVIDSNNFNDRVFFPLLKSLGIAKRVIYAGRHSFASAAVKQEVYLPALQYQMGHNSINTTMKYYNRFKTPPGLNMQFPTE